MKLKFTSRLWLMFAWLLAAVVVNAQHGPALDIANEHIRTHLSEWGYTQQDMDGMTVNDMYTDKSTGITRIYFLQRHQGIPVYNAILNVNISKEGKVFFVGKRFEPGLADKVNTTVPVITPEQAVQQLAAYLGLPYEALRLKDKIGETEFVFEKGNLSYNDIKVKLEYQILQKKALLAWDVEMAPVGTSDMWATRVDAVNGEILHETNWTVYCQVDGRSFSRQDHDCAFHTDPFENVATTTTTMAMAGETYNVWPIPAESPIHGARELVVEPHDPVASPYAWHDTDGNPGAEYTITRGNNVHAYQDTASVNDSSNDEPDGGANLIFDFNWNDNLEPVQYMDAAVVNLFYMNNIMHDFSYRYGFDEASGNFQAKNYTNEGQGGDFVRAEAQDGSGTNNANFSTPPDGSSGRMQMFRWDIGGSLFTVIEPASVSGGYTIGLPADGWGNTGGPSGSGAYISDIPVTGEVVIIDDGVYEPQPSDGCETILNASELNGRVALIDRGGCEFGFKAVQAQNAGAIAVILCNFENDPLGMGPGAVGNQAQIPIISLGSNDCTTIRQFAGNGLVVTFAIPSGGGPTQITSDLDNGVIAHEFGHGISNRLTGGPTQSGCLGGEEQMGEGWSDFMALVTTVKAGDTDVLARGIGNYVSGFEITGGGIRDYPYSTNMDVNPFTYENIAGVSIPHGVGTVWCTMLWDLYWAFSDKYGWSDDLFNGTAGNNMAIRLVFEGMKNQPCTPGFVDGRDAILVADEQLFNGENYCLIYETFARRGLGLNANQGSPETVGDETEDFEIPCACRDKLAINKTVTDFIQPGDEIEVTIHLSNCKLEPITEVIITDEIPSGTQFIPGSSSLPADVQGNTIAFDLGSMSFSDEQTITYKLKSSPNLWSERHFLDNLPTDINDNWFSYTIAGNNPSNVWFLTDAYPANTGQYVFISQEIGEVSRQALEMDPDEYAYNVTGSRPTLRFYHRFQTQAGLNGGVVDVREVGATIWEQVGDKMLRNGYSGPIAYGTFVTPGLDAFSGNSGAEYQATYVDLSQWMGQDVQVRFRFATDVNTNGGAGWLIDDIEFMNLLAYNGEVCVTTHEGDLECAIAPEEGTIVDSREGPLDATEQLNDLAASVYPNPATDMLTIALSTERQQDVTISFLTVDGKQVFAKQFNIFGNDYVNINTSNVPAGFYFVKLSTEEGQFVEKVVIK